MLLKKKRKIRSRSKWKDAIDIYRKIPSDIIEGSQQGSLLSRICLAMMVILFVFETKAFVEKRPETSLALDTNDTPEIRVNFNITMMDLRCEYCVIDIVSSLGTDQNVTAHVTKWHVDTDGVRQRFQGRQGIRNTKQQNVTELYDSGIVQSIETLHNNGEDVIVLNGNESFDDALKHYEFLFVNFYADWCNHCRDLAPTWETLAEVMETVAGSNINKTLIKYNFTYNEEELQHVKRVELPVAIAKLDCSRYPDICEQQHLSVFPTLRLFVGGKKWHTPDYRGHRTVIDMTDWLQQIEDKYREDLGYDEDEGTRKLVKAYDAAKEHMSSINEGNAGSRSKQRNPWQDDDEEEEDFERNIWMEKVVRRKRRLHHSWVDIDHPGCQISGFLLLPRVPGNFHIQARSPHHDLIPSKTNVSHTVNHLSIGEPFTEHMIPGIMAIPKSARSKFKPMNGDVFVTDELHQSHHHYLKLVTTTADGLKSKFSNLQLKTYQILQNSQLTFYDNITTPEAKFAFDLSPINISYNYEKRYWYQYLTSLMAIVGGTFTVFGMLEATISAIF